MGRWTMFAGTTQKWLVRLSPLLGLVVGVLWVRSRGWTPSPSNGPTEAELGSPGSRVQWAAWFVGRHQLNLELVKVTPTELVVEGNELHAERLYCFMQALEQVALQEGPVAPCPLEIQRRLVDLLGDPKPEPREEGEGPEEGARV